ncbi:DUF3221 domain-containing protein [Paenibacillus sp. LHD-38]|uniref:DUF3221 domain-containing protein n=1 Tax=Paenibacillus sp. LHD-38 TaxID=3072143 RepID=UPI00280D738B|nr:DUF3221 domain-containing protein [Paenibacillus sp. LHD-38]MDQ8739012.1 DUF3221 domain-containing protein [Paenibacillus sp. LHD-38]
MKKMFILLFAVLVLATGCSSNNNNSDRYGKIWDFRKGFVVTKEDGRILVVRDKVANLEVPLSEILEEAQPNAIWLSVDKTDYDAILVGDQVSIKIPNGTVDLSYPAQATADVTKK